MNRNKLMVLVLVFGVMACKKTTKNTDIIPVINYQTITKSIPSGKDTILIKFGFKDGDADLGTNPDSTSIYLKSTWDSAWQEYNMPDMSKLPVDPNEGEVGAATIIIPGAFYVLDSINQAGDSVKFELYVKDMAGHTSNHITTPTVLITP